MARAPRPAILLAATALVLFHSSCGDAGTDPGDQDDGEEVFFTLGVSITGRGSGVVRSSPAGIECRTGASGTCEADFLEGSSVTLTAEADSEFQFAGWGGAGSGDGARVVSMTSPLSVTAEFADPSLAVQDIAASGGSLTSPDGRLTLDFPEGALSQATEITIRQIDASEVGEALAPLVAAGTSPRAYELGPSGLSFDVPVAVRFDTGQDFLQDDGSYRVAIEVLASATNGTPHLLGQLGVAADAGTGTVTLHGTLEHFSEVVHSADSFFDVFTRIELDGDARNLSEPVRSTLGGLLLLRSDPPDPVADVLDITPPDLSGGGILFDPTEPGPATIFDPETGERFIEFQPTGPGQAEARFSFRCLDTGAATLGGRVGPVGDAGFEAGLRIPVDCAPVFLLVTRSGEGTGTVTSDPAGIACGESCRAVFDPGTVVTLTAAPDPVSVFGGWTGDDCESLDPPVARVTMDFEDRSCDARFDPRPIFRVPGDFPTISGAVAAATDGFEIVVDPGTYQESVDFGGKNIAIRSTDPRDPTVVANTIIEGDRSGPVVIFGNGETQASLSGFTIRNGQADRGGGILISGATPFLGFNVITGNHANVSGGGIYIEFADFGIPGEMLDGTVSGQTTTEGFCNEQRMLPTYDFFTCNTIAGNTSDGHGGGMHLDRTRLPILGSTFTGNVAAGDGGGGWFSDSGGVLLLSGLSGNTAGGAGGDLFLDAPFLNGTAQNLLVDRTRLGPSVAGGNGGSLAFTNLTGLTVTGSTVTGSSAGGDGGGVYQNDSYGTRITDSEVSGNSAGGGGGGIFQHSQTVPLPEGSSWVEILRTIWSGNTACWPGGAASLTVSQIRILDSTFDSNRGGQISTSGAAGAACGGPVTVNFLQDAGISLASTSSTLAAGAHWAVVSHNHFLGAVSTGDFEGYVVASDTQGGHFDGVLVDGPPAVILAGNSFDNAGNGPAVSFGNLWRGGDSEQNPIDPLELPGRIIESNSFQGPQPVFFSMAEHWIVGSEGAMDLPPGFAVPMDWITGGTVVEAHIPYCAFRHLHGTITVTLPPPFNPISLVDPDSFGCGHGAVAGGLFPGG